MSSKASSDYARVERAIHFIHTQAPQRPSLADVAGAVGLSEFHFQRLFQRWAGVSPKRFLQFVTLQQAKHLLAQSRSVLETSLELGLSSQSRLHDLFLTLERMTPGEHLAQGSGLRISWEVGETPMGLGLFAATERGLCGLSFLVEGPASELPQDLRARWPHATFVKSAAAIRPYAHALEERMRGKVQTPLSLLLKGSPLQLKVWEALLSVPPGKLISYGDLAHWVGVPRGARVVGAAVGQNPIAYLIPCHRVIHSTGIIGHYRWGSLRKEMLLGMEAALDPEGSLV